VIALRRRDPLAGIPRGRRGRSRGQSLAEFALVLPVVLLITMVSLDFGRVYLGYINLQNMTRAAANYAANNPTAWQTNDTTTITKYQNQVLNDAKASNCQLNPATPASPTFTDANGDGVINGLGDNVTIGLTCKFSVITPVISAILGGSVNVSSSAVFPVRSGLTGSGASTCTLPKPGIGTDVTNGPAPLSVTFTDKSAVGAGAIYNWSFGDPNSDPVTDPNTSTAKDPGIHTYVALGSYTVTLSVTNLCGTASTTRTITVGTPTTPCTVPVLDGLLRNQAQAAWGLPSPPGAGFTTTVQDGPNAPSGNYLITKQSIVSSDIVSCDSTIKVNG
jgi:PKD repeat protein